LWRLMVDGRYQGQGIGGQAMEFAARISRAWGYGAVTLGVADDPRSARPFYERHGYRMTGRIVDTDLEMRLDLGG
ncbi:MAG: GNAT family N-acetyltransferase, partial [Pseudomonadota bacterium]